MAEYSKYNIVYRLQKWMDSVPGQTFLNYAYSWGASIVIFGTLCKLTHLPAANFWLFLGMGTEVFVFFISAFDRPFDKTADGRDLPTRLVDDGEEDDVDDVEPITEQPVQQQYVQPQPAPQPVAGGNVVLVQQPQSDIQTEQQAQMSEAQSQYVEQLQQLVETLGKVNEQSARLATDSEEMQNLNRTLTGISRVYEMQLKSASQQITTIEQINEQSRTMAQQIQQLNALYARMIEAMTITTRTTQNS